MLDNSYCASLAPILLNSSLNVLYFVDAIVTNITYIIFTIIVASI